METWKKHILNRDATANVSTLAETIHNIMDVAQQHNMDFWRTLRISAGMENLTDDAPIFDFTGFDPDIVSCEHLIAALRCTFSYRQKVKGWSEARDVAYEACKRDGHNPEDVLRGLLEGKLI